MARSEHRKDFIVAIQDELPRSRLTLTYVTTIQGEPATVELPFRLLVMGDYSLGSSTDRAKDLEERSTRSVDNKNLNSVMADMKMRLKFQVRNCINPDTQEKLDVEIPIERMRSFSPDEVAQQVPKVRALLLLKQLLLEMQSNIDNKKELRKLIQELFSKPGAIDSLLAELGEYDSMRLPASKALPAEAAAK